MRGCEIVTFRKVEASAVLSLYRVQFGSVYNMTYEY